jgi:hypothetical protein
MSLSRRDRAMQLALECCATRPSRDALSREARAYEATNRARNALGLARSWACADVANALPHAGDDRLLRARPLLRVLLRADTFYWCRATTRCTLARSVAPTRLCGAAPRTTLASPESGEVSDD